MSLWIPKAVYGVTTLNFTQPVNAWEESSEGVGAGDEAASGIGAAIEIRTDEVVALVLRFLESEYGAVRDYVRWAQRNRHLTHEFTFLKTDVTTVRTVRWHGPHLGTPFAPKRRGEFLPLYEFPIQLRRADGLPFSLNWSGD